LLFGRSTAHFPSCYCSVKLMNTLISSVKLMNSGRLSHSCLICRAQCEADL
jgi:hypothetical protein